MTKRHQRDNAWYAYIKTTEALGMKFVEAYIAWETFYRPLVNWDYKV